MVTGEDILLSVCTYICELVVLMSDVINDLIGYKPLVAYVCADMSVS